MSQNVQDKGVKDQYVEVIGGPFDGEIYRYQYSPPSSPLFFITLTNPPTGNNFEYRMCVDGKFRLLDHADRYDSGNILCDADLHATKKKSSKPRKKRKS